MLASKLDSKLVGIILGITVIGCIFLVQREYFLTEKEISDLAESKVLTIESVKGKVLYIINKGEGDIVSHRLIPSEDSTVFSLLEKLAQRENFELSSKVYPEMGVFVESIDGVKNGRDDKYWQYWVNDELGEVAADKKKVQKDDKIEWKFEISTF